MNSILRIYPTKEKTAIFECPNCHLSKMSDIAKYLLGNKPIKGKMKCKCGHTYQFIIERRVYFRKNVNLQGIFIRSSDIERFEKYRHENRGSGATVIEDISITGLKLRFDKTPNIKVGDNIMVEFHLNDSNHTLIQKEVIVRNIIGTKYGVEFVNKNLEDHVNKKIGFYLFN